MFDTTLDYFKTQQKELHRQAGEYHLVRSLSDPQPFLSRLYSAIAQKMILSGERIMDRMRTAS